MLKALGKEEGRYGRAAEEGQVKVPKGTTLTVDRIYIRKGATSFDSITFNIAKGNCPARPEIEKTRFWAKLSDVNRIECEVDELWLDD
jgi:hypothetical protein